MNKTHKTCKQCGINKPIYRFKSGNICFACRQKKGLRTLEKELNRSLKTAPKKNNNRVCLHCKKPLEKHSDGAYHFGCRSKRNRQADEHAKRYA